MASSPTKNIFGTFTTKNEEETLSLGVCLAEHLAKGSIIALTGQLGAGKTCFAKGLARGLGVEEQVTSPTYTIISEYKGKEFKICHIDAYRLGGSEDFSMMGGEEVIFGEDVSIIEWSEIIKDIIPEYAIKVNIKIMDNEERQIEIS